MEKSASSPVVAIVESIARLEGADPADLPPISEVVDPDALDALFGASSGVSRRDTIRVRFDYYGYRVEIDEDGEPRIEHL